MTPALHPALDAAFPAPMARFGRTLCAPEPGAMPLLDLLTPAPLRDASRRFAAERKEHDPGCGEAAMLSWWVQHHLLLVVPCSLALLLVAGQEPPTDLPGMHAVLAGTGQPMRLCLPDSGCPARPDCPAARMTRLLRGHLEPMCDATAAAGLPPRVFWGNTLHVLAWALDVLAIPSATASAVHEAAIRPRWVDGGPNPMAASVGPNDKISERRSCCLRFRLGGMPACRNCPRNSRPVNRRP